MASLRLIKKIFPFFVCAKSSASFSQVKVVLRADVSAADYDKVAVISGMMSFLSEPCLCFI